TQKTRRRSGITAASTDENAPAVRPRVAEHVDRAADTLKVEPLDRTEHFGSIFFRILHRSPLASFEFVAWRRRAPSNSASPCCTKRLRETKMKLFVQVPQILRWNLRRHRRRLTNLGPSAAKATSLRYRHNRDVPRRVCGPGYGP